MPNVSAIHVAAKDAARSNMPSLLTKIAAAAERRLRVSPQSLIWEAINPLLRFDAKQAEMIHDYARRGNYTHIQYLYNEIENCDPTFATCVTRRCSAITELDWRVVRSNERLNRKALNDANNENLIKEQIECIETAIAKIDNLPDALDHLALAAFRGFSVLNIHYDETDLPAHLECLNHWNIGYDRAQQQYVWNPNANCYTDPSIDHISTIPLPEKDVIVVERKRPIDWPALKIFLRASVGERDWGRFLETYGLPPVIITMPEFTSDKEQDDYLKAAESIFEGKSGVVPHGSEVNYASESRGTDPFSAFIEHQQKLYVLLATGGTLTSLAESGSGTLAGNAQMEVWKQIVRADIRIISNAINKQLCEPIIMADKAFKNRPVLAEFQLDSTPRLTADEIADLAGKISSAGFEMDAEELSRATGYTIRKKQESGGMGLNADKPDSEEPIVINAGEGKTDDTAVNAEKPKTGNPAAELAASLQDDFKAVAARLNAILALPEAERATAATELLNELETLVPDDPAMAEVIAEQMKDAFLEQITTKGAN